MVSKQAAVRLLTLSTILNLFFLIWWQHELTDVFVDRSSCNKKQNASSSNNSSSSSASANYYVRPNTIFGLLHYAKTGGTEINGALGARYERVCGNKGYSYDAYQFNARVKRHQQLSGRNGIFNVGGGSNRGHLTVSKMNEIGFEDCDYIANEEPWDYWVKLRQKHRTTLGSVPMELHVPCRDPLELLMSTCGQIKQKFNCNNTNSLEGEVQKCLAWLDRFDRRLDQQAETVNLTLKCFNPIPIQPYVDYMGELLQTKRFVAEYVHRRTGTTRNRNTECIWRNETLAKQVRQVLLNASFSDYFRWCDECLGTERDLLLKHQDK